MADVCHSGPVSSSMLTISVLVNFRGGGHTKLSLHEAVHEMTRQAIPVIHVSFPQNKSLCNLLHLQKNLYVIYYIIT